MNICRRLLLFALVMAASALLTGRAWAAESNISTTPRATVSLVSASNAAGAQSIKLGLLFRLAPDWHIYWSDPGDAGEPPMIAITAPKGASAGPFAYPAPHWLVTSGIGDYVETGTVLLPFTVKLPQPNVTSITVHATWLVCNPKICVPEQSNFTLRLPGAAGASPQAPLFATAAAQRPRASPFATILAPGGELAVSGTGLTRQAVKSAHFYPDDANTLNNEALQALHFTQGGFSLQLKPSSTKKPLTALSGVLEITDPSGQTEALTVTAKPGSAPVMPASSPWFVWIGGALLGGLILNLMPCVFPILAIKALAVARLDRDDRAQARRDSLAYTLGAVLAMVALGASLLALRASGGALGWGFQFQSPVFIAVMAWLILAIGLNFAGLYEIPGTGNFGSGLVARGGWVGSFATGLLAVVVATPCTAPFMAGALAAALAAPLVLGLSIFAALGLGIALPFVLIAVIPGIARLLPRPGGWMLVLRQCLAFPLFATAVWLLWVMALEAGAAGVLIVGAGAVLIGFALWLLRFAGLVPRGLAVIAVLGAAAMLPQIVPDQSGGSATLAGSQPFSPASLATLRAAGQPVLVDMTAAWCITCQVNDRVALAPRSVQKALRAHHVTVMVGDWTRRDPAITAYLAAHRRDGVPLYVYYPPFHAAPVVLPQILTPGIVTAALR